jgi:queuine tRNA-ribosyltransferase accessory subunit
MAEREAVDKMNFHVVRSVAVEHGAPRIGRLALPRRKPIETPNFLALTSRGTVPHMTPDTIARHTRLAGSYMALEDCT